jgi:hypothetical protein
MTVAAAGPAMQNAVAQLCKLVKPGGWIQLMEAEQIHGQDDGPAMRQFLQLMTGLYNAMGAGTNLAGNMSKYIKQQGFIDMHEQLFDGGVGARNKNKTMGERSADLMVMATQALLNYAKSTFSRFHCFNLSVGQRMSFAKS